MLKVTQDNFTSFVGDILLADEGQHACVNTGLLIVHWDGGRFVVRQIDLSAFVGSLEHVQFAPIDIPALP